jgi:hypothetical protein
MFAVEAVEATASRQNPPGSLKANSYLNAGVDGGYGLVRHICEEAAPGVSRQLQLPLPQPAVRGDCTHQQAPATQGGTTAAAAAAGRLDRPSSTYTAEATATHGSYFWGLGTTPGKRGGGAAAPTLPPEIAALSFTTGRLHHRYIRIHRLHPTLCRNLSALQDRCKSVTSPP